MNVTLNINADGLPTPLLEGIVRRLNDPAALHAEMAGDAERFLKDTGAEKSKTEHRTATTLGAKPTGHLEREYSRIEGTSTANSASLWIPGEGRLVAAFGTHTVRPGPGKSFMTIPVAAEAYGKRAREIPGLFFLRAGPKKTPLLARRDGERFTTYFLLVKESTIPGDPSLLPLDEMAEHATLAAENWIYGGEDGNPETPN